jgi:glycyl-tRNA synthetase
MKKPTLEDIVSLGKRRGFIFPGSEIYGGLSGTFDYGPRGVALKNNIKNLWWRMFVDNRDDIHGVDAAILMNPKAWEASGHVSGFSDPLQECKDCNLRVRNDHWLEVKLRVMKEDWSRKNLSEEDKKMLFCPKTKTEHNFGPVVQFNMMFKTQIGAIEDSSSIIYLRPETAGGMFVNFKNIVDSMHPKLPFGLAQIGKAFRNEIAPRDFVFRSREFEQMEVEYFVHPDSWEPAFEEWHRLMHSFAKELGLPKERLHDVEVSDEDRAHYSKRTIDFEFDFPFGQKELWGLAYRTDFDLSAHEKTSGEELKYLDDETKEKITPHVIEPSLGVDRTVLAVLTSAYNEDELGGETRVVLRLSPKLAPVKAMVSPLLKNKPELVAKAKEVRDALKQIHPAIAWDDNGNIGKRYRRQDEIGTPWCVTIDFDTLTDGTVTLRDRDTGAQTRHTIEEIREKIRTVLA